MGELDKNVEEEGVISNQLKKFEYPKAEYSKKTEGPVSYGWFSLGQSKGIKWILWKTNVTLQRQEKQGDRWLIIEELRIAPKILKEMVWRIPGWLASIEKNDGGRKK